MAISEHSMIDAEVLAVEEITRRVDSSGADRFVCHRRRSVGLANVCPRSSTFDRSGKGQRHLRLLDLRESQERQASGRTKEDLLIYPMAYEGLERSPTSSTPALLRTSK